MTLNDPELVRREYASEVGLVARKAVYSETSGPDARDIVFAAEAEARPLSVLDAGCGEGELRVDVVALDQSERMVS